MRRRRITHEASSFLARSCTSIAIEDLHIAGMLANRRLARSLSDAALGALGNQLAYTAVWHGGELVPVDRFYPSSKTCSGCGR